MSRSEQKRQRILHAATELFCQQGLPNTSMDEVAKLAQVSKQTVYAHFGCKDDLFAASIESRCIVHGVSEALLHDPSMADQTLRRFAQHFGAVLTSPEAITVFRACVSQADTHPEVSKLFYSAGPEYILSLLSDYLAKVSKLGGYQFDHPHHCAVRFCLLIFGEMRMKLELGLDVSAQQQDREQYLSDSVTMFLNAYKVN